jgi:DNA-binding NarL/FixJ family response regulator
VGFLVLTFRKVNFGKLINENQEWGLTHLLTKRERQILKLIGQQHTTKEICKKCLSA